MDKKYLTSYIQTKTHFPPKPFTSKKQTLTRQNDTLFTSSNNKKYIPDEQSAKLILNYFQYNNFQDFNTWQQIAKTKTDYKFDSKPGEKIECQLVFRWQANNKENITIKTSGRSQKNAKRKALVQLIETLMSKGLISNGFKEKNFIEKLPRRKRYDSSASQEDSTVVENNQSKRIPIYNLVKENNINGLFEALSIDNVFEAWNWSLSKKSIDLVEKVLDKVFGQQFKSEKIQQEHSESSYLQGLQHKQPVLKQVSYVEQSKDPFEEDLTVFIRYQQLQRTKHQPIKFNLFPIDPHKSTPLTLSSKEFRNQAQNTSKFDVFGEFKSFQQISDFISKRATAKTQVKVKSGFFDDLKEITLPKFDQDMTEQKLLPIKTLEKMFNHLFYLSQDYPFALQVLQLLESYLENIEFFHTNPKNSQNQKSFSKQSEINQKAQEYYKEMKKKLSIEMLYNMGLKISQQNLVKSNSIGGMLNVFSSHTRYDGLFLFTSKEPEQIMAKKVQKKTNFNEFFEQYEFCTEEAVLLVNKLNQKRYIGIVEQLSQNFKIYIPFLLFDTETEFPAPFTVHKLVNLKLYNKISSSLVHVCKNYIKWIDLQLGGNQNITLIYQTPSASHLQLIQEMLAQFIAQKLFILIVSENYQNLTKILNQQGFKCIKVTMSVDQKIVSKNNIILTNQLNVCCDAMKSIAFDRVIIDQAHRIPEIISLMSIIKSTKKVYLIGDPNLPRSQMKSQLSKTNQTEKSLFERYLQNGSPYIYINPSQPNIQQLFSDTSSIQTQIFDNSIVQWLKHSVYGQYLMTDLQVLIRKTPLIKGFNWPSNDYRLCFINVKNQFKHPFEVRLNEECFLITLIIAQVLKSGFTQLQQISCCCVDSSMIPVLQRHLVKILMKLNIQPLQWQIIFQRLIKPLNGSIWNRNDLIIVLAEEGNPNVSQDEKSQQNEDTQLGKKLNSALLQAQRGLIIIGDVEKLSSKSPAWSNFLDWMSLKRLIMSYKIQK